MRAFIAAVACGALPLLVSCSDEPAAQEPRQSSDGASPAAFPQSDERVELDPAEFTAEVTNPWFPLEPGTRWTYRETTEDGQVVRVARHRH